MATTKCRIRFPDFKQSAHQKCKLVARKTGRFKWGFWQQYRMWHVDAIITRKINSSVWHQSQSYYQHSNFPLLRVFLWSSTQLLPLFFSSTRKDQLMPWKLSISIFSEARNSVIINNQTLAHRRHTLEHPWSLSQWQWGIWRASYTILSLAKFPVSLQFTWLGLGSISEPCGIVTWCKNVQFYARNSRSKITDATY